MCNDSSVSLLYALSVNNPFNRAGSIPGTVFESELSVPEESIPIERPWQQSYDIMSRYPLDF